jgi:hypothetical protein
MLESSEGLCTSCVIALRYTNTGVQDVGHRLIFRRSLQSKEKESLAWSPRLTVRPFLCDSIGG